MSNDDIYKAAIEEIDTKKIREHAKKLAEWGLHPVVITSTTEKDGHRSIGKKPTHTGWPTIALHDEVSPDEFYEECNLGILCGTPVERNGSTYYMVDVDIDIAEAAPFFKKAFRDFGLPQAYSWGRPGKPDSHHLFLVDKATNSKQSRGGIAEIRAQTKSGEYVPYGNQTITFPSVWNKAEKIEVIRPERDSASEPPTVNTELLLAAYKTALAAFMIAQMMPEHPRNTIRMALFRVLSRGGVSELDAIRLVSIFDPFTINPEGNSAKWEAEAQDIYSKVDDSEYHLYGFPTLLEHFGEQKRDDLSYILSLLGVNVPGTKYATVSGLPKGFTVSSTGVWHTKQKQEDKDEEPKPFRICSKLEVVSIVQEKDGDAWGLELAFNDMNAQRCTWTLPRSYLTNDGSVIREELLRRGFQFIDPSKHGKELFVRYLMNCAPETRKQSVTRLGWHDKTYVSASKVFSQSQEEIVLQSTSNIRLISSSGTLDEWKNEVSARCVGNSRLVLGVSCAFAAILLPFANGESGGIHIVGPTSIGKTTTLAVAASVMSGPKYIQQWRATSNGLEAVASNYNHALLPLDEIGQADPRDIGEFVYMLSNNRGKLRMSKAGTARPAYEWNLLYLSTGEKDLQAHMSSGGKRIKAGQMVRCLDIPGDAKAGLGLFEDIHDSTDPGAFATDMKEAAAKYYGVAFPAFIEAVQANFESIKESLKKEMEKFQSDVTACGEMSGEVYRAVQRFSLIAAAGEIATKFNITGWQRGQATKAAKTCMSAWMTQRGGLGAGDTSNGIKQVRKFLELHGTSRFEDINPPVEQKIERIVSNRAGFRNLRRATPNARTEVNTGHEYFILPGVFKEEVCEGYDDKIIAKELLDLGVLVRGNEKGRLVSRHNLPGMPKQTRVYHITSKIFDIEE